MSGPHPMPSSVYLMVHLQMLPGHYFNTSNSYLEHGNYCADDSCFIWYVVFIFADDMC